MSQGDASCRPRTDGNNDSAANEAAPAPGLHSPERTLEGSAAGPEAAEQARRLWPPDPSLMGSVLPVLAGRARRSKASKGSGSVNSAV